MFYLLKNLLYLILVILKLKCNNLIFIEIMILYASYVCLHAFSLHQESLDLDPTRRTPRFKGGSVTRVRDEATQTVASSWRTQGPIEGTWHDQASYMSLNWEVSFRSLCVGWYLAICVFLIEITQESHLKPPGQDLPGAH
jgi:hypothetical protein